MSIKEISKTIEILRHQAEEVGTTAELAVVMAELAFWERKLQEVLKSK